MINIMRTSEKFLGVRITLDFTVVVRLVTFPLVDRRQVA